MLIRRENWKAEDCAYKRRGRIGDPCVYCGQSSDSMDHVPPLAAYIRMDEQDKDHCDPAMYPACRECNSLIGAANLFTITERRALAKERLRKKYRRLLAMPRWDEDELAELDERMADEIRRASYFAEHLKHRLGFYNRKR